MELEALERLNLNAGGPDSSNSPLRSSMTAAESDGAGMTPPAKRNMEAHAGSVTAKKIDIDLLERKAEATGVNGHGENS